MKISLWDEISLVARQTTKELFAPLIGAVRGAVNAFDEEQAKSGPRVRAALTKIASVSGGYTIGGCSMKAEATAALQGTLADQLKVLNRIYRICPPGSTKIDGVDIGAVAHETLQ